MSSLRLTEDKRIWRCLMGHVSQLPVGTSHGGTVTLIEVTSAVRAEASGNDELQRANHTVDAASQVASSDFMLSAQR